MKEEYSNTEEQNEIDLIELGQKLWSRRRTILKFITIFGLIGFFVAIFSESLYTAKTIVIPQTSESNKMGGLGGFAAMAGINLKPTGSSNTGISPNLYPQIISSIPYKRALLEAKVSIENNSKVSYREYYLKHYKSSVLSKIKKYTIGLPNVILSSIRSKKNRIQENKVEKDSIYRVSNEESYLFGLISNQLSVDVNNKEGFVNIQFTMPKALASAQMLKQAQILLQKKVTEFKTNKVESDYEFIYENYKEAKKKFIVKQSNLANFKDRNQGLTFSRSTSKLDRLSAEYNLANNIYTEFAKQLESQKIKLKENTPLFSVIEPVSVPLGKSKPKKLFIIIVYSLLGFVLGLVYVFINFFVERIRNKSVENEL